MSKKRNFESSSVQFREGFQGMTATGSRYEVQLTNLESDGPPVTGRPMSLHLCDMAGSEILSLEISSPAALRRTVIFDAYQNVEADLPTPKLKAKRAVPGKAKSPKAPNKAFLLWSLKRDLNRLMSEYPAGYDRALRNAEVDRNKLSTYPKAKLLELHDYVVEELKTWDEYTTGQGWLPEDD